MHAVEYILKEFDELIICVMAAQYNFTLENPFTAGERIWMIRSASKKFLDRIIIVPILNIENNSPWIHNLKSFTPPFEVLFSNHPLVKILAEKEGMTVKPIPFLKREEYVGERIREMILEGDKWENLLPDEVVKIIEEINGVDRIKRLKEKDII